MAVVGARLLEREHRTRRDDAELAERSHDHAACCCCAAVSHAASAPRRRAVRNVGAARRLVEHALQRAQRVRPPRQRAVQLAPRAVQLAQRTTAEWSNAGRSRHAAEPSAAVACATAATTRAIASGSALVNAG